MSRPDLTIVVPTISRREESLARCLAGYDRTCEGISHEVVIVKDKPSWPAACNEGYDQATADIIHFTSDDLEPVEGWWQDAVRSLSTKDELPAPRVFNFAYAEENFDNTEDGADGETTHFTRVPIMRRDQWERIGRWPEMPYYADLWLSEKGRTIGIETRMIYSYSFIHHWSGIGRLDSRTNMDASGRELMRLREEF